MNKEISDSAQSLTSLAGEIVAAYVSHNSVPISELPGLIGSVRSTISNLASGVNSSTSASSIEVEKMTSAQIRKSVEQHGIVSFIDGKIYKTLKRHLTANGLSPQSYRERYGLPADYPLVAPSYAEKRSALAKAIGLGVPGGRADQRKTGKAG